MQAIEFSLGLFGLLLGFIMVEVLSGLIADSARTRAKRACLGGPALQRRNHIEPQRPITYYLPADRAPLAAVFLTIVMSDRIGLARCSSRAFAFCIRQFPINSTAMPSAGAENI